MRSSIAISRVVMPFALAICLVTCLARDVSAAEEAREVRVPGMGLEFEHFGGSCDRRAIDAYVHGHESSTLRPEGSAFSV